LGAGIWCMEEPAGFLGGPPGSLKSTHYNPRRNSGSGGTQARQIFPFSMKTYKIILLCLIVPFWGIILWIWVDIWKLWRQSLKDQNKRKHDQNQRQDGDGNC